MRTLKLRTELTDDEIHEKSAAIAALVNEKRALADEKRRNAKRSKDLIDQKAKLIEELSEEVTTRHEMREVEVSEMREGRHVITYRNDSGAVVSKRKLTASEEESGDIDDGADQDLGARAAEGSRIPHENPGPGRVRVPKPPDPWKATETAAKRETARGEA